MSAEARLTRMIQHASDRVFEMEHTGRYSVRELTEESLHPSELDIHSTRFACAAVLGSFAIGGSRIEQLIVNEGTIESDYDFCLAERAINDGYNSLMSAEPVIKDMPEEYLDEVLAHCAEPTYDKHATPLVAGIYALKGEDESFEPYVAFNSRLNDTALYIREIILDEPNTDYLRNPLSKTLINPTPELGANIAVNVIQHAFKTAPSEHFSGQFLNRV